MSKIIFQLAFVTLVIAFLCCQDATATDDHDHGQGHSHTFRKQESTKGHSQYAFGYDIHDPWGATNFRKEKGDFTKKGGWVEGVYGLKDKDGRARLVKYIADKNGFNAVVKTNEPGTSDDDTANAVYNGEDSKGKWSYDVSVKDSGKGKKKDSWSAAASSLDFLRVKPAQAQEEDEVSSSADYDGNYENQDGGEYEYGPQAKVADVKKLKLYLKPQYDYYYGSQAEESV